jgi:hypothetical protein
MLMMKKRFCAGLLIATFSVLLTAALPLGAQVTGATLAGTITDSTGKVIPSATITVRNLEQGTARIVSSNGTGEYLAPNLVPGTYQVEFSAPGFSTEVKQNVTLTVGERPIINVVLKVGAVDQTIEVQDTASSMELGTSAISAVVSGATTRELPLNGRDWTQLATLQPGIAAINSQPSATSTSSRGNRGFGQQLTISGGRPQQNSYRLDGIIVNDYANSSPGSTAGLSLGTDSIQEFSVVSSNYSASYGMTSGGVINAITRAGTNQFHGSAYEFVRNDYFDAQAFFDKQKLPFRRNQFGGTLGGPIVKNRTFIFGNYEGFRQVLSSSTISTVPSANARQGNLVAGKVAVNPNVAPYLGFWPLPNGKVSGDTGSYQFASKEFTPENFVTARVDQTISPKDSIFGTYLYDNGTTQQPDALNVLTNLSLTKRQVVSIEENHIFSNSFYNAARVGANRENAGTLITAPGANQLGTDQSLGAAPGLYAPGIQVSGLTTLSGGLNATSTATYGFTTPQFNDDAFLTKGNHSIKFGFAFERIYLNTTQQTAPNGIFKFNSLTNFLTNVPASLQLQVTPGNPRNIRQNIFGGYIEDDWRLHENLTVTVGLRYEPSSVPSEVHGKTSNLRTLTSATTYTGDPFFQNSTLRNFEPRIGFAYSPGANQGRTAIRGGFGIFDVLPLTYQFNLMTTQAAPFMINVSKSSGLPAGSFATAAYNIVANTPAGKQRATYVQYNPPRNYVEQWNLSLEQQFPLKITFKAAYVGTHGVHQALRTTDANIPTPTISGGALIFPCAVEGIANQTCKTAAPVINPNFGQIDGQNWVVSSVYSGLLTQVSQELSKGFQWQASFTWQKSLDGSSSVIAGGPFQNSLTGQFLFHPLRGPSDFNVPKVFVANLIWNAPKPIAPTNPASYLINGWELGSIFQVANGQPFTPVLSGDVLGLANTVPFDVPDRLTTPGCQGNAVNTGTKNALNYIKTQCFIFPVNTTGIAGNRFGNAGRNSLMGPGLVELDFSIMKNFALTRVAEGPRLQFRAEAFNLPNRPNLGAPYTNNALFDTTTNRLASAGQITTTATTPREIQLGLKLLF